MLTKELNERLTRVGPGTPMGNLLRRYWYPIARTPELDEEPVLAVTLLGENLALYRTDGETRELRFEFGIRYWFTDQWKGYRTIDKELNYSPLHDDE